MSAAAPKTAAGGGPGDRAGIITSNKLLTCNGLAGGELGRVLKT